MKINANEAMVTKEKQLILEQRMGVKMDDKSNRKRGMVSNSLLRIRQRGILTERLSVDVDLSYLA